MTRIQEPSPIVAQRLELFSNPAIKRIAGTFGVAASATRAEQLQRLAGLIGTERQRAVLEQQLSEQDWELLDLLPLGLGQFRLRVLLTVLWDRGLEDRAALENVSRLLACGCLLPVQAGWNQARLGIDFGAIRDWGVHAVFELAPGVGAWAQERVPRRQTLASVEPPDGVVPSALAEFQRGAFVLLAELARRPLRITAQGTPNKTDMRRLTAVLSGGSAAKRQAASEPIPWLLYFLIAVLAGAELLHLDEKGLYPCADAPEFFQEPAAEQAQKLLTGWLRSRFDDFEAIPSLTHAYYTDVAPWSSNDGYHQPSGGQLFVARLAIERALMRLLRGRPDAWFRIDDLAAYIHQQFPELLFSRIEDYSLFFGTVYGNARNPHRPYPMVQRLLDGAPSAVVGRRQESTLFQDTDWMEVEGAFVRQVLGESLRLLGLVEVGPERALPERFHLTPLGRTAVLGEPAPLSEPKPAVKVAIVQPSFEVVITDASGNFGLLAQLDAFAERRTLDRAATYQLTRSALVRGLDAGWTGPRILETLEAANAAPLPQNVRYTIEEWIGLYERLTLHESAQVLETDDPAQLDRFLADKTLGPRLGQRLGPSLVLVPAESVRAVVARVTRLAGRIKGVDYSQSPEGLLSVREPDLITLQPEAAEPYLQYRVGSFAAQQARSTGGVSYRIDPESVAAARTHGMGVRQILSFLTKASGQPLPADFQLRLLAWGGEIPPVQTETLVAVLLPAAAGEWKQLRAIAGIGRFVRAVTAPRTALVDPADLPALREALAARGVNLSEATIPAEHLAPEAKETDLRSLLAEFKQDPEGIRETLKSLGILGKIEPPRRGWYY
jgi:hypothetical protein